MAKISHVRAHNTYRQISHEKMGSATTQSVSSWLPGTNKCQNGQNESCLAHSVSQLLSHAWNGLRKHPECLQLIARHQQVPECPKCIMFGPQHARATKSCMKWAQRSATTQSAPFPKPGTNKCQNGQNASCLAHSVSKLLSQAWSWLSNHPDSRVPPVAYQASTNAWT
jgi:uncharacterized membrane protein